MTAIDYGLQGVECLSNDVRQYAFEILAMAVPQAKCLLDSHEYNAKR